MKVLIATTYIYKKEWPEFTRNRTGFGIMVNDIFECVSKEVDTYLISQVITKGHENVLKHTWGDVFKNAKVRDWCEGIKYFFKYKQNIKNRIKYFYYALNSGSIRKTIKSIKPNVVHIHGIGIQLKPFIDICDEVGIPYIVTLHGLIGLDETVSTASWNKQMEREFLVEADIKGIPVTVVSTGIKRRIEKNYLNHEAKNITVICNGTRIPYDKKLISMEKIDLRKEFGIINEKLIIVIGTVCDRKNQIQIVEAIGKVKTPCQVFFCGADASNGMILNKIKKEGLCNKIHLLGFLPHEKVAEILEQVDLNIVASKDEGFGLSIIEAYSHGVPTVTFSDLDAVSDLFNERTMVTVINRNTEALADGIEKGLSIKWNKNYIKEYAKSFSLDKLTDQYKDEYKNLLLGGGEGISQ